MEQDHGRIRERILHTAFWFLPYFHRQTLLPGIGIMTEPQWLRLHDKEGRLGLHARMKYNTHTVSMRTIYPDLGLCAREDGREATDEQLHERLELKCKGHLVAFTAGRGRETGWPMQLAPKNGTPQYENHCGHDQRRSHGSCTQRLTEKYSETGYPSILRINEGTVHAIQGRTYPRDSSFMTIQLDRCLWNRPVRRSTDLC